MKMIWVVVRSSHVKGIAAGLEEIGVAGCTVYPARGYGEEWHLYEPLVHGGHHKIEVIIADDLAERVVTEIIEKGWTGLKGDGVLAVFDLDKVVHLRSKSLLT